MKCHPWSGGLSSCALALPLSLVPRADASAPRGARSSAPASRRTDDLARLALLSLLRRFAPACARRPRIRSGWPGASVAATSGLSSPVLTVNSIISAHFQIFLFAIVSTRVLSRATIPVIARYHCFLLRQSKTAGAGPVRHTHTCIGRCLAALAMPDWRWPHLSTSRRPQQSERGSLHRPGYNRLTLAPDFYVLHGRSKSLFRVAIGEPARGPPPGSERTRLRGNLDAACGPHHALTPAKTERRADPPWRMPLVPALRVRDLISACAGRSVLDTRKRASQDLPWAAGRQGHVHSPTAVRREFRLGHTNACAQNGRGAGLPTPGN